MSITILDRKQNLISNDKQTYNILIIDDDEDIKQSISKSLIDTCYIPICINDSISVLESIKKKSN